MRYRKILLNGMFYENPNLRLLLGMCPSLAVTSMAANAVGMGLATTAVLICSNAVISALRNVIPKEVRLPSYIVIVAGFVTAVSLLMEAYLSPLYESLGLFLSLIVVNCIILGRAEMFASKNPVGASIVDGLGMGLGFTGSLLLISTIREILGNLSWFGISLAGEGSSGMLFFILPAGGFFVLGLITAAINALSGYRLSKQKAGCSGCPAAAACAKANEGKAI
ncbi:MAG: electron transport complex subunit E [Clostridia bacterium]|nr:electron transport complex subunit E [Clostridia bacterium]